MPSLGRLLTASPLVALATAACIVPTWGSPAGPVQGSAADAKPGAEVEVRCIDDSNLKLKILDDRLEVTTRYGTLLIPVADIRRVEFASRVPSDVAEKVAVAISKLGHADYQVRESASAELKGYRERSYPALLRAVKHEDPEVSRRAEEAVKFLQAKVPAGNLEPREFDVIHTEDSKITGRLTAVNLRVSTFQFGDQLLKLADIRSLRSGSGIAAEEVAAAGPAPTNMMAYQNQIGKEVAFSVTGAQPGGGNSSVWGTDHYTLDSNVGAAAVHAGLVQAGQTATVRVRVVASPPQFVGSFRNGIGSSPYGNYPAGAYEFLRK